MAAAAAAARAGLPSRMRAVLLRAFGGPEALSVARNVPLPHAGAHDVLVHVAAVGVNPLDCRVRAGYARALFEPLLPLVVGREFAGTVVLVGGAARAGLAPGDRVFGVLPPAGEAGACAEFVAARSDDVALTPPGWTHEQAAALPFAALTAWRALESCAGLRKGESLLVLGAGGAVGGAAVQLARAWGCRVSATARPRSAARVAALGADSVADADAPLRDEAQRLGWGPFDVALDTVGGAAAEDAAAALLRPHSGRLVTLHGGMVNAMDSHGLLLGAAAGLGELAARRAALRASHDVAYSWAVMRTDGEAQADIARLAASGALRPHVGAVLPLSRVAEAHAMVEQGSAGGKVVLRIDGGGGAPTLERDRPRD